MKKDKPIECTESSLNITFKVVTMIMVKATGNWESGIGKQLRGEGQVSPRALIFQP